MKKLLLSLLFLCFNASATQVVPIVWPFSMASNQANALRTIVENANKAQNKYEFIIENKPGAGGAISVNYVTHRTGPTILMTTTSYFIRPMYYPNESYDVDLMQPIAVLASGSPMVMLSKNIKDIDQLKKQKTVSIGFIMGSITETAARTLQKSTGRELVFAPYQSTTDATRDAMGGHLDISVEFIKDSLSWAESGTGKILGLTGTRDYKEFKSLSSQGLKGFENIVNNFYMVVSKNLDENTALEFHQIISSAMTKQNVVDIWKNDTAVVDQRSLKDTVDFWNTQKSFWRNYK